MSAILFFTSGHGFGHASRDVEVMNVLGARGHAIEIRSAVDAGLLARTMRVPYRLVSGACDTGIVQSSSLAHDDEATVDAARMFYESFGDRVRAEAETFREHPVDAVVSDIPPLGLAIAAELGVPGIALGNFTWDW